jgi:valyl-tRNA synthetase
LLRWVFWRNRNSVQELPKKVMEKELPKVYDPKTVECQVNQIWQSSSCFHAAPPAGGARTYTIVIPPPNVTAALHLGHALNNALQDVLIRYHRMQQLATLWMPGTDHAGIATQTVVEKRILAEEGKRRTDFSRDQFVARVQAWKDEYEATILGQLAAMGCSCDWQRTRFTMDEVCAKAVRETFFRLFRDGLIYRGKRLVNWDPATQTVLADDEVEHQTIAGFFWYLRYPLVEPVMIDGRKIEHVTVATTRPETMLGDTAVAMNPRDPRAKALAGAKVRLPIVGRIIPIIADEHVVLADPNSEDEKARFSTGFLKVTPAHDPDDWQIAQRHGLAVINIMAPDGSISDRHGWDDATTPEAQNLVGMDRFEAREAIVDWFRQEKLLEEVRDYSHEVGHSYRSHVPIEPYLSDQWYVAVKRPISGSPDIEGQTADWIASHPDLVEKGPDGTFVLKGTDAPVNSLAGLALSPLLDGRLKFTPERYARTYQAWLENLRDWPISRQLWWGHRIPVWSFTLSNASEFARAVQQLTDLLKDCGTVGQVWSYKKEDDAYTVYVCLGSDQDDGILEDLASYSRQLDAVQDYKDGNPLQSGQPTPPHIRNHEQKAFDFLDKYVVEGITRDDDVLDTWFSSALWPFSTLGWPDASADLKAFYPGDVLCTAREIITLWVSRMVMMGQYCVGDIPFKDVYIHAMIQDGLGRKMSKSLGNGIDPLVAIDSHGADAMRFTLASMTTDTQDIRMPVESLKLPDGRQVNTSPKFDVGRNFCNKLWNASRFAMMNLEGIDPAAFDASRMDATDRWILSRLAVTIRDVMLAIDGFKFSEPLNQLYRFFWNDLCDWYLEWAKPKMQDPALRPVTQNVLAFVLDQTLRMLHPFLPFITEGIFQNLNGLCPNRRIAGIADAKTSEILTVAKWPDRLDALIAPEVEAQIDQVQAVVRAIREIRNSRAIAPGKPLKASARGPAETIAVIKAHAPLIRQLAVLEGFEAATSLDKPADAAVGMAGAVEVFVHNAVDVEAERQRLDKQRQQLLGALKGVEAKLGNENFTAKAKPEVVAQTRAKLTELQGQLAAIEKHLAELG